MVISALLQANTVKDKTKGAAEQAYNTATDFPSDAAEMAGVLLVLRVRRSLPAAVNAVQAQSVFDAATQHHICILELDTPGRQTYAPSLLSSQRPNTPSAACCGLCRQRL